MLRELVDRGASWCIARVPETPVGRADGHADPPSVRATPSSPERSPAAGRQELRKRFPGGRAPAPPLDAASRGRQRRPAVRAARRLNPVASTHLAVGRRELRIRGARRADLRREADGRSPQSASRQSEVARGSGAGARYWRPQASPKTLTPMAAPEQVIAGAGSALSEAVEGRDSLRKDVGPLDTFVPQASVITRPRLSAIVGARGCGVCAEEIAFSTDVVMAIESDRGA